MTNLEYITKERKTPIQDLCFEWGDCKGDYDDWTLRAYAERQYGTREYFGEFNPFKLGKNTTQVLCRWLDSEREDSNDSK